MSTHPDVLIVGGGVIGLTTAYYLRKAGASVAVVDQADFGRESSWAGAGILPPAPTLARAQTPHEQLAAHSARLHPLLAAELRETTGLDNGYLRRGGWALYEEDEPVPLAQWKAQGISFENVR